MTLPTTLDGWLAHCAAQHPRTMDLSLERTQEVARRLGIHFNVPVITVAGTNGKGSTCAMIDSIARHAGYRVGLYQKPELVHFTERCRLNGQAVAEADLLPHFQAVETARDEITLTLYEFSTLAIVRLLSMAEVDLVILEVGLGGRHDSVNAFDCDCAVITSIDLDHTEWLGPDREAIGLEKAQIMRPGRPAIVSDPLPPQSVVAHAEAIGADLWRVGRDFNHSGDRLQWGWAGRGRRYAGMSYPALRGANQIVNASGAIAALIALRERLPINAQAHHARQRPHVPRAEHILDHPPRLVHETLGALHGDDAGRVLAAVLQQQQRVVDELVDGRSGNHADDAAHGGWLFEKIVVGSGRQQARRRFGQQGLEQLQRQAQPARTVRNAPTL